MPTRQCPESTTVTVAQAYGRTLSQLSTQLKRGQQFTDFAIPTGKVMFLAKDGTVKTHNPSKNYVFGGPRLIITERKPQTVVFVPIGEGIPTVGQPYFDDNNQVQYGIRGMRDSYTLLRMEMRDSAA